MTITFSKLNRRTLRSLPVGERLTEKGIVAERTANGDLRWSVATMVDGQRIHRVIGMESAGVTREQCERKIAALRTKAIEDRLDLPAGRKTHRSLKEAADEYIDRLEVSGGKNLKPKRQHLRQHLIPALGNERINAMSEYMLQRYRRSRRNNGASDATINREMATLSHLLSRAVAWKWVKADAIPTIPKAREVRKPISVMTDHQCDALMQGAFADTDDRLWLFVAFGLNTAMRHREILRVRYDQIDFTTRRIFLQQAKAGGREQPITPALATALLRQRSTEIDKEAWVFPSLLAAQSKQGHRTNMARPFQRAVVRAGLDPAKVTPHTMRHTAITRLVQAGADLPTIQRISGHRTLAMVLRYTHIHGSHVDAAIGALDRPIPSRATQELHANQPGGASR